MTTMHPTFDFLFIADHATFTHDGKLSLIGIFDRIVVKSAPTEEKPIVHPLISAGYRIRDVDMSRDHEVQIDIVAPNGKILLSRKTMHQKQASAEKVSGVFQVAQLRFEDVGAYTFKLTLDGTYMGETKLAVYVG